MTILNTWWNPEGTEAVWQQRQAEPNINIELLIKPRVSKHTLG